MEFQDIGDFTTNDIPVSLESEIAAFNQNNPLQNREKPFEESKKNSSMSFNQELLSQAQSPTINSFNINQPFQSSSSGLNSTPTAVNHTETNNNTFKPTLNDISQNGYATNESSVSAITQLDHTNGSFRNFGPDLKTDDLEEFIKSLSPDNNLTNSQSNIDEANNGQYQDMFAKDRSPITDTNTNDAAGNMDDFLTNLNSPTVTIPYQNDSNSINNNNNNTNVAPLTATRTASNNISTEDFASPTSALSPLVNNNVNSNVVSHSNSVTKFQNNNANSNLISTALSPNSNDTLTAPMAPGSNIDNFYNANQLNSLLEDSNIDPTSTSNCTSLLDNATSNNEDEFDEFNTFDFDRRHSTIVSNRYPYSNTPATAASRNSISHSIDFWNLPNSRNSNNNKLRKSMSSTTSPSSTTMPTQFNVDNDISQTLNGYNINFALNQTTNPSVNDQNPGSPNSFNISQSNQLMHSQKPQLQRRSTYNTIHQSPTHFTQQNSQQQQQQNQRRYSINKQQRASLPVLDGSLNPEVFSKLYENGRVPMNLNVVPWTDGNTNNSSIYANDNNNNNNNSHNNNNNSNEISFANNKNFNTYVSNSNSNSSVTGIDAGNNSSNSNMRTTNNNNGNNLKMANERFVNPSIVFENGNNIPTQINSNNGNMPPPQQNQQQSTFIPSPFLQSVSLERNLSSPTSSYLNTIPIQNYQQMYNNNTKITQNNNVTAPPKNKNRRKSAIVTSSQLKGNSRSPPLLNGQKATTTTAKRSVSYNFSDENKTFKCETCGKAFRRSEHLKRHIRSVHSSERPFACPTCDKKFSRSDNLAQHIKTHKKRGDV